MLVLLRRPDQSIVIDGEIIITVLSVDGERVRLGIQAPANITVLRQELLDAVSRQNRAAVMTPGSIAGLARLRGLQPAEITFDAASSANDHNAENVSPSTL